MDDDKPILMSPICTGLGHKPGWKLKYSGGGNALSRHDKHI